MKTENENKETFSQTKWSLTQTKVLAEYFHYEARVSRLLIQCSVLIGDKSKLSGLMHKEKMHIADIRKFLVNFTSHNCTNHNCRTPHKSTAYFP